jgi:hypothetical protein
MRATVHGDDAKRFHQRAQKGALAALPEVSDGLWNTGLGVANDSLLLLSLGARATL